MPVTKAQILTVETVPSYLLERVDKLGEDCSFLSSKDVDDELDVKAIVGGNVNYAFCITSKTTGKTIFIKQAPEFVAIFGPDGFPLTSERMQQEINVYNEWYKLLGDELKSKYLPKIYYFDSKYKQQRTFLFVRSFVRLFVYDV